MKYFMSYRERPAGSAIECEGNQVRILQLFQKWQMPESIKIREFVTRVGEFGGYIVFEAESLADVHLLTTVFAVFDCKVEPVIDVQDSVAIELKAIAWRQENS